MPPPQPQQSHLAAAGPPHPLAARPPPYGSFQVADPFAGLDNMGGKQPPTGAVAASAGAPPLVAAAGGGGAPSAARPPPPRPSSSFTGGSSVPPAAGPAPLLDPTAAALARMGVPVAAKKAAGGGGSATVTPSGSRAPTPTTSRNASPVPPLSPTAATPSPGTATGTAKASPTSPGGPPPAAAFAQAATNPTRSRATAISPEEEAARKQRQAEEARLKAQLRRDREEQVKAGAASGTRAGAEGGLGASGVVLAGVGDGTATMAHPGSGVVFNPFDYLTGTTGKLPERKFSPIYRVYPFWSFMNLTTYIQQKPIPPEKAQDRTFMYEQMARSLSFVSYICQETEKLYQARAGGNPLAFLRSNHMACEACIKLMSLLPHSAGASGATLDGLFLNFLNVFISLLENVQTDQQLVLPGGWQQPDYTYLCLFIVRNVGGNKWTFTVCNTGKDGLQYHPASFDPETGKELKQQAMTVWDIPGERLMDSSFWTLLFRMQVYPSRKNNAAFLYTKLLPALNSRPLLSNLDQGPAEYLELPDPLAAQTYHPLARLALTTTPAPLGARTSKYSQLLVMNAAVELAFAEIANAPPSSMDPEDTRILKLAARNLANFASTVNPTTVGDGTLGMTLSSTWDTLDRLLRKLSYSSSKPMDQYSHGLSASALSDEFSNGKISTLQTGAGSAAHPLFGRLRRDNYEEVVKNLMGDPRPDPIVIPPVLTDEHLPPVATDYMTASSSLQRIADACSLLLQQRRLIKNSPAFAASAAQYAITTILPMPNSDPRFCFWRKGEMRRETQLNLLFLIRRLCRIYSASTACVQHSRGLIAIRSITLACGACVADAICRVVAVDDPSTFALHYSGLCEGPTQPFGIEAGAFDTLGSNLPIYDPNLCSLRFQCLDYLRRLTIKDDGTARPTIFNFDKSLSPMEGDMIILDQLSINLALQRPYPKTEQAMMNHCANLISGRNGSIIEVLPEFEYFRDIVFHFKHAVSGKAATPEVPETHTWLPSDATLHWEVRRKDKEDPMLVYFVKAFQAHHQDFVERIALQEEPKKQETSFKGFLSLWGGKTTIERSRLSSADPTTVVNSCGEKFQAKR